MRKVVAGLAMTLDGVVEAPSGNWMRFDDEMNEVIAAGIAQSDAILLGRRTYLEFAELWPKLGGDVPMADYMNSTPKYVLSRTLEAPLTWAGSTLLSGGLTDEVSKLKRQPGRNIQVPGSPRLVRSLLAEGLLDQLALMIHPIVLGSGMRLFDEMPHEVGLELVEGRALKSGVLLATYEPARAQNRS
jgi:dihydrofolate reductase